MGVFAEFERAMIRERVNAGLARARASAKRLGRPRVGDAIEAEIRMLASDILILETKLREEARARTPARTPGRCR